MQNPIKAAIEHIKDKLVEELETELEEKKSITSYAALIYRIQKNLSGTKLDKIVNFDKYEEEELVGQKHVILPSIDLDVQYEQLKALCYSKPPFILTVVEEKRKTHTEEMNDYYDQFISGKVNKKTDNSEFEIRFETYSGIFRYLYDIKDGEIIFKSELGSNGKKFLPYLN